MTLRNALGDLALDATLGEVLATLQAPLTIANPTAAPETGLSKEATLQAVLAVLDALSVTVVNPTDVSALAKDLTLGQVLAAVQALPQGYSIVPGDVGQSAAVVAGSRKEVTFSTAVPAALANTDISNFAWASVHLTSLGTGTTVAFQGSNDGVNWVNAILFNSANSTNSGQATTTAIGVYLGPVSFRYFRLNVTGISAGTCTGVIEFWANAKALHTLSINAGGSTVTPSGSAAEGAAIVGNPLRVGGTDGANIRTLRTGNDGRLQNYVMGPLSGSMAEVVVGDTQQNALLTAGNRKEVTFSTTVASAVAVTDVSNYSHVSVHVTSNGTSSTNTFQVSNDNVNWTTAVLLAVGTSAGGAGANGQSGVFHGPISARYFRISVNGISAGTTAGVVEFFANPRAMQSMAVGGAVAPQATPANGATPYHLVSIAGTNPNSVKASGGNLYEYTLCNTSAAVRFVKFFNKAAAPTLGTDTPVRTVMIPAGQTVTSQFPVGMLFSAAGIAFAITGGAADADTTAVAAGDVIVNLAYS